MDSVTGPAAADGRESSTLSNSAPSHELFVVALGASASGLEALEKFFDNMPADSGLAFAVVQHLSPDFKSLMNEFLARHTRLVIHRVTDGMQIDLNSIYLIPPKKEMIVSESRQTAGQYVHSKPAANEKASDCEIEEGEANCREASLAARRG